MTTFYTKNYNATSRPKQFGEVALRWMAVVVLLGAFLTKTDAQITVVQNANSQALAQLLAGNGVTISNWTKRCDNNGSGTFTNVSSNLGVDGGVVLSSGRVTNIPQAANNFASTQFSTNNDAQLSTLTSGTIYDPCVLEFDIVPQGPLLRFEYVFASEEYPEFVCSPYNDVFGFFISGPNPGGGNYTNRNIAIVPNTANMPVAINTVNPGISGTYSGTTWNSANCQSLGQTAYYRSNITPVNASIVYDGMTVVLTAIAAVVPCQTYHLKIAIADVADRIYDSGVFLKAYSFTSNPISVSAVSALDYAGFSSSYEGCVGGTYTISLSQVQTVDVFVQVQMSGTATNGVDYTAIPSTITIPAGQTSVTVDFNPLVDGITEPMESATLSVLDLCTGVPTSSATINIRDDAPATITATDTNICRGASTQLIATGGVTYSWSPATGLSNASISNPIATPTVTTTYTVTTTFGSCVKTASRTIRVSNPSVAINATPAGTVCNGGTVSLSASPSGGVAPYTYLWSNGATANSTTVAAGGTYTVTARDAYGCSATASRTVTISNLSVTGVVTNVACVGNNNGIVDITVTGTNAPFTYAWTNGATSQDITNVGAGSYTVTVSNTVGCSVVQSYTVTQPAAALTTTATSANVLCNGGNTGSINLTPNGGVSPYAFTWSNGATTEDINNLIAGSYTVTVRDFNNCTTTRTVSITQPTAVNTSSTQTNLLCFGATNGAIDLTVSGGRAPYTFSWSNAATTEDITGLSAGAYTVIVADSNGCTATRTATITQPTVIAATATPTNPSCFGTANGSVALAVSGGTPVYTYTWSNGATTQNISSLAIGTYTVTVRDANLCTATASTTLTQPAVLAVTSTQTNVSCNGGNTGTITTTVTGGTAPYTYNWGGGVTTANRTALAAGTYNVTVTDTRSCTATLSVTISQPSALGVSSTSTNVSCNGGSTGSIDVTVTGGNSPYTFNWGGGVTTEDRSNLTANTYNVTVTDANGCTSTHSRTVTQPSALSFSQTRTNVLCNGNSTGSINATIAGGTSPYVFTWSNGATTQNISGLSAATYTLTATDNRGCTVTGSATITQPSAINITPSVTNASCAAGNDGTITLSVSGGVGPYTYNWGGGVTTQNRSALVAGTYSVTVTDASSCTATASIAVTQIGTGISLTSSATNVSCFGGNNGAVDITVTGGNTPYNYNWGGGITTEDRTGLTAGTYSVTVTDQVGCSAISTNNISQPTAVTVSASSTNVACFGGNTGTATLIVGGGTGAYTYTWSDGNTSQNRTGLSANSYSVTVRDANLCSVTATVNVTQPAAALNLVPSVITVDCFGASSGAVNVVVSGGTSPYTYIWSNGNISQNLSAVVAGTYTLTATDSRGCTATSTSNVSQPASALSATPTVTNVLCGGASTGAISLVVSGGTSTYSFNWGGGITSQNRSGLSVGTYTVTVTDNRGCTATSSSTITSPTAIAATAAITHVSCFGGNNGAINLTVNGGVTSYTYNWGGGITTQNRSGLSTGPYSVTVTDANNCTVSLNPIVNQPTTLTLTMNSGTSVCANPTGTATAVTNNSGTSPYNYVWSHNASLNTQSVNGLPPGPISVTVTDAGGCSASATVNVGLSGNNTNANFSVSGTYCAPASVTNFTHTGSASLTGHSWNFGNGIGTSTLPSPSYSYPAAGTYNVTHIVYRGFCSDTVVTPVNIYTTPQPSAIPTNVTCNAASNGSINVAVVSGTPAYSYNWGGGVTTQNRTGLAPGTYTVTVTDTRSCSATANAVITQPSAFVITNTNTNVTCNGGNNGSIDLTVSGATPAYSYTWSNGATTEDVNTLTGGNYTVTVRDVNSCSATSTINMYEPNAVSIASSITQVTCNGNANGSINLTVTGGTGAYTYNWGGGITTQNRAGLLAGTYNVTVRDANNCSASASFVITQPSAISTTLTPTNVLCRNGNNGSISTATTGGTSPYSYVWNDGNTSENRSLITAGTYQVTVNDANTCSATASVVVSQPASSVSVSVVTSSPSVNCYGDSTAFVNITTTGGTSPYTYLWNNGVTTQNRTGLLAGIHTVTATDANGCSATVSASVAQPATPLNVDSVTTTDALCFGANSGSIHAFASGGTSPLSYLWSDGNVNANRNAAAGTYNVTITDANACTTTASATITQPAAALSASTTTTNVNCFGGNNGAINLTVSGGTTTYSYNWGGGVTTQNRTGLAAGTYNVTITDANACTTTASTTITQPNSVAVSSVVTNVFCHGGSTGAISLNATGGTGAYSFDWGNGITTQNRTGLSAGTYSVIVTDVNGCSGVLSSTVTEPAQLQASSITFNVSCNGGNNGSIVLNVSGGTIPYIFNWSAGINQQNIQNLQAGSYTVTVIDINNCSADLNVNIVEPSAISITSAITNVSCFGGNNGAVDIAVVGGTPGYTYNWGSGITTQNRTNLTAANYTLTVSDANSCTATATAAVIQPAAALSVTTSAIDATCFGGNNGSASAVVSGGTTPYNYNWNSGASTQINSGLSAGLNTVTVTDAQSCSASASATIGQASQITITETHVDALCNASSTGSIDITVTGGTGSKTYAWDNGSNQEDLTGVLAGNYTVTVTDANSCTATSAINIAQPTPFTVSLSSNNVSCNGGSNGNISLTVSGATAPYTYLWNNGATTSSINNIVAGNYSVVIRDNNGCQTNTNTNITQPLGMTVSETHTPVSCFGGSNGSISVAISGGSFPYTFTWNDNATSQNRTNLVAGTYQITVNDINSCAVSQPIIISQPLALSLSLIPASASCNGALSGSVALNTTGGTPLYTYLWSNSATTQNISNVAAGNYTVTVRDANTCSASASATVSQPTAINLGFTKTDVTCFGLANGVINVTTTGGATPYQYNWSNGAATEDLLGIIAGNYSLNVRDANGCTSSVNIAVAQPGALMANAVKTDVACNGANTGAVDVTVSGGTLPYTYNWSNSATSDDITGLVAGTYTVSVRDNNGCSTTSTSVVLQATPIVVAANVTNVLCNGASNGSIQLAVSGGTPSYTFDWSNGMNNPSISNLTAGIYSATVTDANGCIATATAVSVTEPQQLSVALSTVDVACFGQNSGRVNAIVTGGNPSYNYLWSNGATTQNISNIAAGNYTLNLTDSKGCTASSSIVVNTIPQISVTAQTTDLVCANSSGAIDITVANGTAPYSFDWNTGANTEDINRLNDGTYTVRITDSNGCSFDASFTLTNTNSFTVTANGSTSVTLGQTAELTSLSNGSDQVTYNWTPGNTLSCTACQNTVARPGHTTTYTVIATDTNGCVAQDTVTVQVIEDHTIFTPNAFSPNGDGNNDFFQLFGNLDGIKYIDLMIFDRWGEKVFEATQADFQWDGTYKGVALNPSVFVYVMKIVHLDGTTHKVFKGSITLIR